MRFRKLRIAFSTTCIIAVVLLIVLWVRSYNNVDSFCYRSGSRVVSLDSKNARLYISTSASGGADLQPFLRTQKLSEAKADLLNRINASENAWGFGTYIDLRIINTSTFILPHWFPALLFAI